MITVIRAWDTWAWQCTEHVCVNTHTSVYVIEELAEYWWCYVLYSFVEGRGANGIHMLYVVFIRWGRGAWMVYVLYVVFIRWGRKARMVYVCANGRYVYVLYSFMEVGEYKWYTRVYVVFVWYGWIATKGDVTSVPTSLDMLFSRSGWIATEGDVASTPTRLEILFYHNFPFAFVICWLGVALWS